MLSDGRHSSDITEASRSRSPFMYTLRPSRGISASLIWSMLRPGLRASSQAASMVSPVVRPLPAVAGTRSGMRQLPPPLTLHAAG